MAKEADRVRIIKELSKELREENLAVFAGAGLSSGAGFVNWVGLLTPIAEELGLDIEKEKINLVALAQYHCNANASNRSKLNSLLIENFSRDAEVTENHKILARLPVGTFWTTNYDKLIEKALSEAGKVCDVKYTNKHLATTKPRRDAIVFKMHGDIDHPADAVLTKDDYERYHVKMQPFLNALAGDLISKTFLFLGFSFSDPNLDYILSRVRVAYDENQRQHYAFLRTVNKSDCADEADFEYQTRKQDYFIHDLLRFGIKSIMVGEYAEITEILIGVEREYRRNTVFISGAAQDYGRWDHAVTNEFIYNLSRSIIEAKLNVVSGFGLGVGSSVISGALEPIYMKGKAIRNEQLILRPFPQYENTGTDLKQLWTEYRKDMVSCAGIAIFIFGNKKTESGDVVPSSGMREEFQLAHEKGLFLLPIGATGYMAKELWEEVNGDFEKFNGGSQPKVREIFSKLGNESFELKDIYSLTMQILEIIK